MTKPGEDPQPDPEKEPVIEPILPGQEGAGQDPEPDKDGGEAITPEKFAELQEDNKKLKASYDEAHATITRTSQELAELKRSKEAEPNPDEDEYLTVATFRQLTAEQQQQAQLNETSRDLAAELGVPVSQIRETMAGLAGSLATTDGVAGVVRRLVQAGQAEQTVGDAAAAAEDSARRNARGVQTAGGAPSPAPVKVPLGDMTADQLKAHIERTRGRTEE